MEKQNIFITNDDGINAKGLRALIEVASEFGKVTVVAPEYGMSGMSHSITMSEPLFLRKIKISEDAVVYACQGSPVDCVKIAVDYLMKKKPTLVLSGINHGANSNMSVLYSGTMGAAMEGALYSIPSIGLSLLNHEPTADFTTAKAIAKRIIKGVLEQNRNPKICLNVNIPDIPLEEIAGIKVCKQATGCWIEEFEPKLNPRGNEYFWLVGKYVSDEPECQTNDEWALRHNYVSVVPVQTDLTDYRQLDTMHQWTL